MNGEVESANGSRRQISIGTSPAAAQEVTQLLADWSHGDQAALQKLTPLVYEELRRLAHHYMEGQQPDHTLQTTALVHEAYLRLVDQSRPSFTNHHIFLPSLRRRCAKYWSIMQGQVGGKGAVRVRAKLNWTKQR